MPQCGFSKRDGPYHWDSQVMRMSSPGWTHQTHNVRGDGQVSICVETAR
jgi:hypothetical protein